MAATGCLKLSYLLSTYLPTYPSIHPSIHPFIYILAAPTVNGSSWGRDRIRAAATTYATAMATGSLSHCARLGIKPIHQQRPETLQRQHWILNLLCQSGNSIFFGGGLFKLIKNSVLEHISHILRHQQSLCLVAFPLGCADTDYCPHYREF